MAVIFHCSVIAASTSTICSVQIMDGSKILIFCQTKRAGDDLTREMRGWIVRFSNTWPQIPCRWSVKDDKDRWKSHFDGLVMFVESWELRFLGQYWNNTGIWVATDLSRTDGFPALCIHGEKRQEELCQLEFCWAIAISGWWFQLFFVRPYVGKISHLTLAIQYFSDGLVQLPSRFWKSILLEGCWNFLQFLFSPGERVGHERV